MGSAGQRASKRRKRPGRSRRSGRSGRHGAELPLAQVHSPYTFEGEIEGLTRFAIGARHARGWRRKIALGMAWIIPGGFIAVIAIVLISTLINHL